jgi:chloramphenicol 3-O-phosphotransferase
MIDVIAQSGRFSSGTTNLSRFVVEAEKRYWLHVAIDRLTGKIIDQQLEAVYE